MSDFPENRPNHLQLLATVEHNTERLLPLLSLLETTEEGPDRIDQLTELLRLILDAQQRQATALKSVLDRLDRVSRR